MHCTCVAVRQEIHKTRLCKIVDDNRRARYLTVEKDRVFAEGDTLFPPVTTAIVVHHRERNQRDGILIEYVHNAYITRTLTCFKLQGIFVRREIEREMLEFRLGGGGNDRQIIF